MAELYIIGASVLDDVLNKSGSLKGLVLSKTKGTKVDAKTLLALTANALAFYRPLNLVIDTVELLRLEKRAFSPQTLGKSVNAKTLVILLAHDLLLAPRGRIAASNAWPPKAAVARHNTRLKAELVKLQIKEGKSSIQELRSGELTKKKAERVPRWARVNERLTSVESVLSTLRKEGWTEVRKGSELLPKRNLFARSSHLNAALAFHPSQTSSLLTHTLYQEGHLILQDLASCFPAEVLLRPEMKSRQEMHVLDATAAPGNKTTHLSALLAKRDGPSKITALEQSAERYKTLASQLRRAGALDKGRPGCVRTLQCDFTKQDREDYADVTHMLLDPSCSGSGILNRLDYLTNEQEDETHEAKEQERLRALSSFQSSMIDHAMQFPALRRLVYSTCSIHAEENENVVMRALQSPVAKSRGWKLAPREQVIPSWATRGLKEHCEGQTDLANSMIRCQPGGGASSESEDAEASSIYLDATNGFFLACFVRTSSNAAKNKKRNLRAREQAKQQKRARLESDKDIGED